MSNKFPICVALPMYRSKYNGWIALESLIRQKEVPCEWELVVAEEVRDCFGEERVMKYSDRLRDTGCGSIKYISLNDWIPLSLKWVLIAKNSKSEYFLLQGVDDFTQPNRLKETYDIFKNTNADWVRSPVGYVYDIHSNIVYLFDRSKRDKHPGGLNIATKTDYIRSLNNDFVASGVDHWIFRMIKLTTSKVKIFENISESWKKGVCTSGLNRISLKRAEQMKYQRKMRVFEKTEINIKDILEEEIINRLRESYLLDSKMMSGSDIRNK